MPALKLSEFFVRFGFPERKSRRRIRTRVRRAAWEQVRRHRRGPGKRGTAPPGETPPEGTPPEGTPPEGTPVGGIPPESTLPEADQSEARRSKVDQSKVDQSKADQSEARQSEDPPPPWRVDLAEEMGLRAEKASGARYVTYRVEAHHRLRSWLAGELGAEGLSPEELQALAQTVRAHLDAREEADRLLGGRARSGSRGEYAAAQALLQQQAQLLQRPLPEGFDAPTLRSLALRLAR